MGQMSGEWVGWVRQVGGWGGLGGCTIEKIMV